MPEVVFLRMKTSGQFQWGPRRFWLFQIDAFINLVAIGTRCCCLSVKGAGRGVGGSPAPQTPIVIPAGPEPPNRRCPAGDKRVGTLDSFFICVVRAGVGDVLLKLPSPLRQPQGPGVRKLR